MENQTASQTVDLTALAIARSPIETLLPDLKVLRHQLQSLGCSFEIVVVGPAGMLPSLSGRGAGGEGMPAAPGMLEDVGARYASIEPFKYGLALKHGLGLAQGRYVLTMDADFASHVGTLDRIWQERDKAAVVIASRFTSGARAAMPLVRRLAARALNHLTARLLSVPVRDLTSGYRLIRREALDEWPLQSDGFDILVETIVRVFAGGRQIVEVPTTYVPHGRVSRRQPLAVAWALVRTVARWWRLRNSIDSADYDERAFFSRIPPQRWWQRRRHHVVVGMAHGKGLTLDVGCGSSVILPSLGQVVGLDISMAKLRFAAKWGLPLVRASAHRLPLADEAFDCVVCSQVIEHMPIEDQPLGELVRVLKPGGTLVVGTPDYASLAWRIIEPLYGTLKPGGYKDEHITHFTRASLVRVLEMLGCRVEATQSTFGELVVMATKTQSSRQPLDAQALVDAGVSDHRTAGRPSR